MLLNNIALLLQIIEKGSLASPQPGSIQAGARTGRPWP